MAAPHVAGVAALSRGLAFERDEIVDCIISTAVNPVTGSRGAPDPVFGYAIVDAAAAVVKACRAA